jgi:glycosyltransferase involved in cell wall biosynthesis
MKPLLSILIPTFNRAEYLDRLLCELASQINSSGLCEIIEVVIGNNSSVDNTSIVISSHLSSNTFFSCVTQSSNIGAELNILSLFDSSCGNFRWIIGDDDLPRPGLVNHVVNLLQINSPSLLYLPSKWATDISVFNLGSIEDLVFSYSSRLKSANDLHIWVTFISSWVFNAEQFFSMFEDLHHLSELIGSNLLPIGWILPLLIQPKSRILIVEQPCILATSGNTGGYAVLQTFMINYPKIVHSYTKSSPLIRAALIGNALRSYLPFLIVSVRRGSGFSDAGDCVAIFPSSLKLLWAYPSYWFFCIPALFLPLSLIKALSTVTKKIKRLTLNLLSLAALR